MRSVTRYCERVVHRDLEAELLADRYARSTGSAVAFLDESYEVERGEKFYIMTAVVVSKDEMAQLRKDLVTAVGGRYWHTTEVLANGARGSERARSLCSLLGSHDSGEVCIVAQHHQVHGDGEQARAECLRGLVTSLYRGDLPLRDPIGLVVLEQRKRKNQQNFDTKVVKELRSQLGDVGRNRELRQTSPTIEPLLWLPDLAASALRQRITRRDNSLWRPLDPIAHVVHPLAQDVLDPAQVLPRALPSRGGPTKRPLYTAATAAAALERRRRISASQQGTGAGVPGPPVTGTPSGRSGNTAAGAAAIGLRATSTSAVPVTTTDDGHHRPVLDVDASRERATPRHQSGL